MEKKCEKSYPRETQSTIRLEQLDGYIIIIKTHLSPILLLVSIDQIKVTGFVPV